MTRSAIPAATPGRHAASLLTLGLPLIGGHLAQFAIGATDTLMLGWYGVTELAAGVLGHSFFFVFFIMGSGFAWAVMPMVAAESEGGADGRGNVDQIRRVTRMGLWLSMLFAAACLPAMIFSEPILLALGQTDEVADLAAQYLRIAGWAVFPALGVMVLRSYLAALERTQGVLWTTLAGVVVNAGANWLLIFGNLGFPEMGVQGAAVASVTVNVVMLAGLALYVTRVFPGHHLFARLWRPDWQAFGQVFRLGWPIGLTALAEVGMFSATAVMVGWLGAVPLAAHGIAVQISTATFMVHMGLSNAATIRAGKALGRGDAPALARGAWVAVAMSLGFAATTVVLFLTFPEPLVSLFLGEDEPARAEIVALGVTLLVLAAAFQTVDGAQVMIIGLLRGVQDTRVPMVIAAVSYWGIGMPACYVFGFGLGFGAAGVWAGLVLGLAAAAALLAWRFWGATLPRIEARLRPADGAHSAAAGRDGTVPVQG